MKKCPYCAEDIQDAAIKCRYCGSMLTDAHAKPALTSPTVSRVTPPPDVDAALPPDESDERGGLKATHIAIGVVGLLLIVAAVLVLLGRARGEQASGTPAAVSTAATLVPHAPAEGEYRFLDLPWNMPRAEVRARLEARGFRFLERDELGDEAYEGRVDGRDAGLDVRYAGDGLSKVSVILLPADPQGAVLLLTRQVIADAFGSPKEQRDATTIWPERGGTLIWLTANDERFVIAHYESAGWPVESRRRRGQ